MLNRSRSAAFLVPVLAVLCAPVHGQRSLVSSSSISSDVAAANIPNFGQVTPILFRGGQPSQVGFSALAAMGVTVVVDLRGSRKTERDQVNRLGMQYVALPWHCPFPRDDVFARFLTLLRQNPGKKIFVHCRLGDDRVSMMVAVYLMGIEGWPAAQAKAEMRAYGFTSLHHLICPGDPR